MVTLSVAVFDCPTSIPLSTITPISFDRSIFFLLNTAWWNYELGSYSALVNRETTKSKIGQLNVHSQEIES